MGSFEPIDNDDQKLVTAIRQKVLSDLQADPNSHSLYLPASFEEIAWAENGIGTKLPPLIRELYLQVGNGGFGPFYGIAGLLHGKQIYRRSFVEHVLNSVRDTKNHLLDSIKSIEKSVHIDTEEIQRERMWYESWNRLDADRLIWYCDWGCNITTLVDYTKPELPLYRADALQVVDEPSKTLRLWWQLWLDGKSVF